MLFNASRGSKNVCKAPLVTWPTTTTFLITSLTSLISSPVSLSLHHFSFSHGGLLAVPQTHKAFYRRSFCLGWSSQVYVCFRPQLRSLLKYHVLNVSLNTMFKTALLSTSLHLSYPAIVFFSFFSLPKNSSLSNTLYKLLIIFVVYYLFLPDRM